MSKLPSFSQQFADWYQEVLYQAELVDQAPVRGCFVIRPYGYAIWENIQKELDKKIKETGHQNAAFPLLIPESFLKREAEHVEGFSPELAVVTFAGGKELEEPLVVRPTSETIIHYMFARWIKSWRDLPLKINQWANVVRWEMRPRAFLRTTEFFWQEGHTAHETETEALQETLLMLEQYRSIIEDFLAIPVQVGQKSAGEKFPGADATYTIEGTMPDGKALQMCTSHMISRNFARAFQMTYQTREGNVEHPYLTSWGFTTRVVGALIMMHGDENGIIIPPKVAPIQIVIVPILKKDASMQQLLQAVEIMVQSLKAHGIRVHVDADTEKTPGFKFNYWELKGVPLRIEIGMRDLEAQQVVMVNRVTREKTTCAFDSIAETAQQLLNLIHRQLFERAQERRKARWYEADDLAAIVSSIEEKQGFYQTGWCNAAQCEERLKEHKITIRCILPENMHTHQKCFACGQKSKHDVVVAKAY